MGKYYFLIILTCFVIKTNAQREVQSINSDWKFYKGDVKTIYDLGSIKEFENINIPHDWNSADILDDNPGYYRGTGIYEKKLLFWSGDSNKNIYLFFEGVNQDAEVYLNNIKIGDHHGGYTAFSFEISSSIMWDKDNQLIVKVSNAEDPDWLPLSGDITNIGGIYRDVYIIKTNRVHFDMNNMASTGVFIKTDGVKEDKSRVSIHGAIENELKSDKKIIMVHEISDPEGLLIATVKQVIKLKASSKTEFKINSDVIKGVKLWSPEAPNLYTVTSKIFTDKEAILDEIKNPLGFRYFSLDKDSGFYLNGKHCFIKGVGRQQDYFKIGSAVPDEVQVNDIKMIKDMGCNFLRAHFPQDPVVWDECDKLGIMMTGRIPLFDKIAYTKEFTNNTMHMMKEMILQNYNHPSVIMWEYMNEIFGGMDWYWPKPQDEVHMKKEKEEVVKLAKVMEKFTRETDPDRITEQVFHTDPTPIWYKETGLTNISMMNGWNIYFGWYHGSLQTVGKALDEFRNYEPSVPYIISEFGAGSDNRIHTDHPTVFDFSGEYQDMFHKVYLQEVAKRPWISGMCIWTWSDFQVDGRNDVMPHFNNKGMVTADRILKDSYFLYKAHWNPQPLIHIAGKDWTHRTAIVENGFSKKVNIYSNLKEVELFLNGVTIGKKQVENNEASFDVAFKEGDNIIEASGSVNGQNIRDVTVINYRFQNFILDKNFNKICINVGQSRTYFYDPLTKDQWLPDREYSIGSWGHKNGQYYRIWNDMKAWQGIREGVEYNIKGTEIDPIYQTFLVGITDYQVDVPDGNYSVELYFTEPFQKERRLKPLEMTGADSNGDRVFDVVINNITVLKNFNIAGQFGVQQAVNEKFRTKAEKGQGISIRFNPIKGEAILSGIIVRKI